ncbi:polysaccharide deacetylase [Marinobacter sp. LV10R520-4]|uniref:polysaccharide deacetylase family protein n=1 Tax=Marinobacter sp. LV10R520-4 TaxID=1761796 RepID=UPI000BF90047|nr:polysaccharide deacetylase family protein [Marinobacter sp. LV10R520-4]PFG54998.1 polysaccharide deacetylase [Marinobacter sp. LV10R520-4]
MHRQDFIAATLAIALALPAGASADLAILQYHHISNNTPGATSTSPALFEAQLQLIDQLGLAVEPLYEATQKALAGNGGDAVALSFDDAYSSVYSNAAPILARLNYPYTLFVNTDTIGKSGFMTLQQLQELASTGLATIANHSAGHGHLAKTPNEKVEQWQERVHQGLDGAQTLLEKEFGNAPPMFAYPYGEFDAALEQQINQRGWLAFGQQSGPVGATSSRTRLPRFPMANAYGQLQGLENKLLSKAFPVPAKDLPDGIVSTNPPHLRMSLPSGFTPDKLTCFGSGQGRIKVTANAQQANVQAPAAFSSRRFRYNCTYPAGDGRFYWLSQPWLDLSRPED